MSELARRVRERRAALGLSQEELADRMGYRSKSSITKLEKGVNDLPQSKLEELAAALDTTPAWLLGIETAAAPPPGFEPLPEMARVPDVYKRQCLMSSMMTNAPSTLPNSRIHRLVGRMAISRMFMGVMMAVGAVRLLRKPTPPRAWIPAYSMRQMLIKARAAVTFKMCIRDSNSSLYHTFCLL